MFIDKSVPGRPARFVLSSPQAPELAAFYTQLFGWRAGTGGAFTLGGRTVAQVRQGQGGWLPYLTVPDLPSAIEQARAAGASLAAPTGDQSGLSAVIVDPTGTPLGLSDPSDGPAVEVMAEDGAVIWVEQKTHQQDAATSFLSGLFGYEFAGPTGPGKVRVAQTAGPVFGGVMQFDGRWAADEKSHWLLYFQVADTQASLDRAAGLGGSVWFPPFDTPLGQLAYLRDPQGSAFAVVHLSAQGAAMTGGNQ
jgi:predicted enzyme related to lactoylglutathione lyase